MKNGNLLVSTHHVLGDPNFHRTVILLAKSEKNGSIGFILNKKLQYNLDDVVKNIDINFPLYYGGPVESDSLFYVHNIGNSISGSISIKDSLYWNGDFNIIIDLIKKEKINNNNIRFFLGYSGWEKAQLEQEFKEKSWELFDFDPTSDILKSNPSKMWKECLDTIGGDYLIWSNSPSNPQMN